MRTLRASTLNADSLKLTTYFGERQRTSGRFVADALLDAFARERIAVSVLLRGAAGFGVKHHLRTDQLLTLSEDLPLVAVAVDRRERIEAVLGEVVGLFGDGLITLERALMPDGVQAPEPDGDATKLTAYVGRRDHVAVVDVLHRHGVAGATALLGVDGTAGGARRRARFFAANADVPQMVIAVGAAEPIAAALAELRGVLGSEPLCTLERVRVCKRDGVRLAEPAAVTGSDPSGLRVWQKLMVYCGEQSRHRGQPLASELVRALRASGAAGATSLRGVWGYHGDHAPHGDSLWQLRRRVPVVTVIVDTPERIRRWFEVVDELTTETGLVTSEQVPALRATGPDIARGGLRLADPAVR
jgi:PII-like signaling protein